MGCDEGRALPHGRRAVGGTELGHAPLPTQLLRPLCNTRSVLFKGTVLELCIFCRMPRDSHLKKVWKSFKGTVPGYGNWSSYRKVYLKTKCNLWEGNNYDFGIKYFLLIRILSNHGWPICLSSLSLFNLQNFFTASSMQMKLYHLCTLLLESGPRLMGPLKNTWPMVIIRLPLPPPIMHLQWHYTRALALWTDAQTSDHGRVLCIREYPLTLLVLSS